MQKRKPLAPNNRKPGSLGLVFAASAQMKDKSPTNRPSVYSWLRPGRQNSEGFGGGNRVGRRL